MENLEQEIITATKVTDEKRLDFWPRHVEMGKILAFEGYVFNWMGTLCSEYKGGFWNFYDLSNGGFYIAPELKHPVRLMWSGNYFDGEMSPDAAGIVATLFALSSFAERSPVFWEKYMKLYDYIGSHPEAQAIHAAID